MKAPVLATPADWHGYLVGLAIEAHDATLEPDLSGAERALRRARFELAARERMAQGAMVVVCEIDLARGGDR